MYQKGKFLNQEEIKEEQIGGSPCQGLLNVLSVMNQNFLTEYADPVDFIKIKRFWKWENKKQRILPLLFFLKNVLHKGKVIIYTCY